MSHQDKHYAAELRDILLDIKAGPDPSYGICKQVTDRTLCSVGYIHLRDYWDCTRHSAFEDWDEFSGDLVYPVPAYKQGQTAGAAYDSRLYSELPFWSRRTKHDQARWRLLDHLIQWYSERAA